MPRYIVHVTRKEIWHIDAPTEEDARDIAEEHADAEEGVSMVQSKAESISVRAARTAVERTRESPYIKETLMAQRPRTAQELATALATDNPQHRFAINPAGNMIGHASGDQAIFTPLLGLTLLETWAPMPALLVNGEPIVMEWIPVSRDNP